MRKKKKKTARLNERSAIMLKDELSDEYVGYYGNIPFRKRAKSKPEVCRPGDTFEEFGKTWIKAKSFFVFPIDRIIVFVAL